VAITDGRTQTGEGQCLLSTEPQTSEAVQEQVEEKKRQQPTRKRHRWTDSEGEILVSTVLQVREEQRNGAQDIRGRAALWGKIVERLKSDSEFSRSSIITATAAEQKFNELETKYKDVLAKNRKSGAGGVEKYFAYDTFAQYHAKRGNVEPKAVLSSQEGVSCRDKQGIYDRRKDEKVMRKEETQLVRMEHLVNKLAERNETRTKRVLEFIMSEARKRQQPSVSVSEGGQFSVSSDDNYGAHVTPATGPAAVSLSDVLLLRRIRQHIEKTGICDVDDISALEPNRTGDQLDESFNRLITAKLVALHAMSGVITVNQDSV